MAQRILHEYPHVSLKEEDIAGRLDFAHLFGRAAPVHVEIGSGKGTWLVAQATKHSELNYLGMEWASKYHRYAVDRVGRWGLSNVRIIRTDAADFLRERVPDASVDAFHIYFPDPWPKKRHHKRRFFWHANVHEVLRCLKEGGCIQFVTDHPDYFEQARQVIDDFDGWVKPVEFVRAAGAEGEELVGTNYERKYVKERRNIQAFAVQRTDRPLPEVDGEDYAAAGSGAGGHTDKSATGTD